ARAQGAGRRSARRDHRAGHRCAHGPACDRRRVRATTRLTGRHVRDGTDDDEALAIRAGRGDAGALDELLRRHAQLVHGVCRRVLVNADDALDATQEALLLIARKIHTFDGRARFTTWCYRVATNAALDEARRRARRPSAVEFLPEPRTGGQSIDDLVADQLDVDAALSRLSPHHRAPVALRHP